MNTLGGFLDQLSTASGRIITALNPPDTTVVNQAPAAATNGGGNMTWLYVAIGAVVLILGGFLLLKK